MRGEKRMESEREKIEREGQRGEGEELKLQNRFYDDHVYDINLLI
jgi:hypothetical protein